MAKIKLLVDTDVIIDCLRGLKQAKDLFRSNEIDIHCSILSKKELLSKAGLSDNERKRITKLMNQIKVFKIDNDIIGKYSLLANKYGEKNPSIADHMIAATAWSKNLPLLTRNIKHFKQIDEIKLSPIYKI
ncbi:MAG TPA: type II toxin-antitoxin system VapC family toxin [Nitrospirae bacterium]|nr:ribonuclease VapC19 [bacterium BMS3Abin06]HDH10621.1 type II toxin-antitoxin system VapC family toxin [Nitrospirota bacterium]HDZ00821.1 type II toxin-antitoxin system VapC family toxin [Nitrospirota bacterium]